MKLQDKEKKFPPFDVASGQAVALLATGTVEQYVEPEYNVKVTKHVIHFAVREGERKDDYQYPPEIHYSCSICGPGQITGPNAHKGRINHQPPHGFVQDVPSDVATTFIALRRAWERRNS